MSARTLIVLAGSAVAVGADLLGAPQPWRLLAVFGFVFAVPGLAAAPLLRAVDRPARVAITVAAGIALVAVVAEAMAIARVFSATTVLLVVAAITTAVSVLVRRRPRGAP